MDLLVFAHKAEAQCFLNEKSISQYSNQLPNLYYCDQYYSTFLGQGIGTVTRNLTSSILELSGKIERVINLGVAGGLSKNLNLNKICPIKSCELESFELKNKPLFQLQTEGDQLFKCITTQKVVDTPAYAQYLNNYADLVDMELWGISAVCHQLKIPLSAYKIVSDYADQPTITKQVKERAHYFSMLLKKLYQNKLKVNL